LPQQYDTDIVVADFALQLATMIMQHDPNPLYADMLQELESLKGWKYIVSLLLEAGDIVLPIFRNCMARISAAISWLLVKLIGRALGLIYRGVKQSLVPQQKQRKGQTVSTDTEGPQAWMPKLS
jgi:hypothetical protein